MYICKIYRPVRSEVLRALSLDNEILIITSDWPAFLLVRQKINEADKMELNPFSFVK